MGIENADIRAKRAHQEAELARGLEDGYDGATKPLPSWWSTTTLIQLSTYQRGYFVGLQLALSDGGDHA